MDKYRPNKYTLLLILVIIATALGIYVVVTEIIETQKLIAFCHENYDHVPAADIPGWCIRYMQHGQ